MTSPDATPENTKLNTKIELKIRKTLSGLRVWHMQHESNPALYQRFRLVAVLWKIWTPYFQMSTSWWKRLPKTTQAVVADHVHAFM